MKKSILLLVLLLISLSCQKTIVKDDLPNINGYWEIEKVVFSDGNEKEYAINTIYDYFEIKNNKGIRKKVIPQFDGTFLQNGDFEKIEIKFDKGIFVIHYQTAFSKWTEELQAVSKDELIIVNSNKNKYFYKRAKSIQLINNGKKTP